MKKKLIKVVLLSSLLLGGQGIAAIPVSAEATPAIKSVKAFIPVTNVTIAESDMTLVVGETATLHATVTPSNASLPAVKWVTGDQSIVKIDGNGVVTALKEGIVTAGAYSESSGKVSMIQIEVKEGVVPVTSVALSPGSKDLEIGETIQITSEVLPSHAGVKWLTWTSSNPAVATVSEGQVKAIAAGTTTITGTSYNGQSGTSTITVKPSSTIPVSRVVVTPDQLELAVGMTEKLAATIEPSNATDQTIAWRSVDPSIATVDKNGQVTAKKSGSTMVYATTKEGQRFGYASVVVNEGIVPVKSVTVTPVTTSLEVGQMMKLTSNVLPSNAAYKELTWVSSNPAIATVSADGQVKAVAAGTVTITGSSYNGKTGTATITASQGSTIPATDITITTNATGNLKQGEVRQYTAVITPTNATTKDVTWYSLDTSIVTIDQHGVLTAVGNGFAAIGVEITGTSVMSIIPVYVEKGTILPQSISLNQQSVKLKAGQKITLKALVTPTNAEFKTVYWDSTHSRIASVSQGVVTALRTGTTIIEAQTLNGKTAYATVTVN